MAKVKLALHAPEQGRSERRSRFGNARRYGAWLEALPLGNMTAAGNQLLVGLQEMNQTAVPPRQRVAMLDRTVAPVLTIVGVLDKHYRDAAFPLDEKRDRVGRVAVQFFREIALGYRIAAAETVGGGASVRWLSRRLVARCVHHALAALEQMRVRLALLYRQAPPTSWREIDVLFAFARQNGLAGRIFDTELQLATRASIGDLYERIALLGISNPRRLSQRSIRALAQAAGLWARRTRVLEDVVLEEAQPGLFEIDPGSDDPPALLTAQELPGRFELVLDVRELRSWLLGVEHASAEELRDLSFTDADGKPLIIDRELIRQLLATWGLRRRRSFRRLQGAHALRLVVGIPGAHYMLAGEEPFSRFLREYGDLQFTEAAGRERPAFGTRGSIGERPFVHTGEVLDQSLGGYRLRLASSEALQVRVGEIVLLCPAAFPRSEPLWMLGIVRWLQAADVREIEVGVALLGRDPRPAALLALDQASEAVPHRAIGFRAFGASAEAPEGPLLAAATPSLRAGRVALCLGDDAIGFCGPVELQRPLERTSEVQLFAYARERDASVEA